MHRLTASRIEFIKGVMICFFVYSMCTKADQERIRQPKLNPKSHDVNRFALKELALLKLDEYCRFQKSDNYHSVQADRCLQNPSLEFKKEIKALQVGVQKQIKIALQTLKRSRKRFYQAAQTYCDYLDIGGLTSTELSPAACLNKDGSLAPSLQEGVNSVSIRTQWMRVNRKPY